MTVTVERELVVAGPLEDVWAFLVDPENRASAISVVEDWDVEDDGSLTWHVRLPIPLLDRTAEVKTQERQRESGDYVSFVGRSSVFRVKGEHELTAVERGTRVTSRFVVDGRLPGVESYFKRQLDGELDNLERALEAALAVES